MTDRPYDVYINVFLRFNKYKTSLLSYKVRLISE